MKNITKLLYYLEDHIAVILAVFCPAWVGIFLVLMIGLPLLPEKIARKVSPEPLHIMLAVLGSLVLCVVIAILRMVRDVKAGKPKQIQILIYPLLIALDIFFMLYVLNLYVALQLKQDNANTSGNLSHISKRLFVYEMEHGNYPPQQDFRSLLETLGMNESDFSKTRFYDLYSAEYHAPVVGSSDETIITIRTKWFIPESSKATLLFLRRDGSVGNEYLKNTHAGAAK